MKIAEVTQKPPTPEQLRIKSLAATKERAADALAAERQRQQVAKAQKQLAQMRQPKQAQTQG
jgi:hypothetical protein